jgi:predicted amidohydrolase
MKIRLAQLIVTKNVNENLKKILGVLQKSKLGEWVIFPEGMLSGYYPEESEFLANLKWRKLQESMEVVQNLVNKKKIHCIYGTAYKENDKWFNAAIYLNHKGDKNTYKKVNLSMPDRKCFTAGNKLEVFSADGVTFGIQICRDNIFPEQWKVLKKKGARVVFHINNAIRKDDLARKQLLFTRAFENQYFVVSINNASRPQTLPSLVISPFGKILYESKPQTEKVSVIEIDPNEIGTRYLAQERRDIVDLKFD